MTAILPLVPVELGTLAFVRLSCRKIEYTPKGKISISHDFGLENALFTNLGLGIEHS
jgi:hypothetical protein